MKSLPRWLQGLLAIIVLVAVLVVAGRFSEKSPVFAEGELSIAPELVDRARELRNLFIVVYDQDSPSPMPYGALRVPLTSAPQGTFHHFILTKENLSVMAGKQAGHLTLLRIKARLSSSGFIGQDSQGDLWGEVTDVPLGATQVVLVIDRAMN